VRLIEISKTSTSTAISDRRLTSRERREYFDPGPSANLSLSKPSAPEARDSLPDDLPDNLATTAGGRLPYEINAGDALDELRERARLLSSTDAPSPESLAGYDNLANTNSRNIIAPVSDSLENLRKRHGGCSFPSSTGASSLDSPPDMLEIAGVGADLQSPEEARPTSNRNSPEAQSPEKARRMSGRLAGEMAGTISSHDAPDPQPAMSSARGNRLEKHTWSGSRIDSPGAFDPLEDSNLESYQTSLFLQGGAQPTEFGGFYFLLSIISRLGMASFLETNPHLIDLDFAAHLLRFLSAQLRIPVADPALSSLTTPEESAPQMIEFSLPPVWRERLYRSGPLVLGRINGETGCRILTDRSRKIVLSSWRGPTPRAVREMIGDGHVKRVAYPPANAGATDKNEKVTGALFNSWHRAIRRWCRAYAGLTLPELINRRALITSTRTHTDLFFDVRKADIRIRRAGLDLDPGWVPWLGRAVSFHYLEEEEIDGC
ncbi:MAG TPA: hypothetical protein VEW46_06460, partial [Pyrinomonadaceae bacterium]|nr:hypothetical protein [Pyrinomonadaceae bacterium]